MPKLDIDVPLIEGVTRSVEPNDKPPFSPAYLRDMQMQQVGEWKIRAGTDEFYPDRGNFFDRATPAINRGVDTNTIFYDSFKRKTLVEATSNGVTFVFKGVIRYTWNGGAKMQRLQIYRGRYVGDDFDATWDDWIEGDYPADYGVDEQDIHAYAFNSSLAKMDRQYQPYDEEADAAYFAFSMVIQGSDLYVALIRREDAVAAGQDHSILKVLKISNIFANGWGGDAGTTPAWSVYATVADYNTVDDPDYYLTNDVDLVVTTSGATILLQVVYGINHPLITSWLVTRLLIDGSVGNPFQIPSSPDVDTSRYGGVIVVDESGVVPHYHVGYIQVSSITGENSIRHCEYVNSDIEIGFVQHEDEAINETGIGLQNDFRAYDWSLFGPSLAIDSDGRLAFGFACESLTKLKFMVLDSGGLRSAIFPDELWEPYAHYHDYRGWKNTHWAMIVKDGVLTVYYGSLGRAVGVAPAGTFFFSIRRRDWVFDKADADYNDLEWTDYSIVAEKQIGQVWQAGNVDKWIFPCFLSVNRAYAVDAKKALSYITFNEINSEWDQYQSWLDFIRQDVTGYLSPTQLVTIKAVGVYPMQSTGGLEDVTLIQTEDIFGKCQFWERKDARWQLWKGQMDEGNSADLRPVTVQDKARFYDRNHVVRAGVGNGSDVLETDNAGNPTRYEDNRPPWYGFIDRYFFNNDSALPQGSDSFRIRERRMSYEEPTPPVINGSHDNGSLVEIAMISAAGDEPLDTDGLPVTDTNDDKERYARFTPTDKDGVDYDMLSNGGGGAGMGLGWYADNTQGGFKPTLKPRYRVTHQYKTITADRLDANRSPGGTDQGLTAIFKQPFIEGWFYFAFRLDNGQVTQFTPQQSDDPYKFGLEITAINNDCDLDGTLHNRMAKISLRMRRWSWAVGEADGIEPANPRITSIIIAWAEKRWPAETKFTANPKIIKEVAVAKRDIFKDEPWDGDSEWLTWSTDGIMQLYTYVDYKNYITNWRTSQDAADIVGHATPVMQFSDRQKAWVDGYKYAVVVGSKVFRFNVKMNGQVHEEWGTWSANQKGGEVSFEAPDVNGVEWIRSFPFKIQNAGLVGDDNVVAVGDRDVEWGRVLSEVFAWRFGGKRKELGTLAPDSVTSITANGRATKLVFLSKKAGVQEYDLYSDAPITDQVLDSFVDGRNPSVQSLTTRKGVRDLTATDAMIIHLPDYRLLLVHFPTDGVTWVKDFEAEAKLGKPVWMEWHFAQNPTDWCVHPDGYLVFTDGNKLYRWPSVDGACDDAGSAIIPSVRIANVPVPARGWGVPLRFTLDYDLRSRGGATAVTCKAQIIKDNGARSDDAKTFVATTERTRSDRGFWLPKRANQSLSVAIDIVTPSDCSDFRLYGVWFAANVHKSFL